MPRNSQPASITARDEDLLRSLLRYNPKTGKLHWRVNRRGGFGKAMAGKVAGTKRKDGYISIMVARKCYLAHRVAFFLHHGRWPSLIDHKNGKRADNRIANLREATPLQNRANRQCNGGYQKHGDRYYASIVVNGERKCLGGFRSPLAARRAYLKAKREYFGEYASAA